MDDIQKIILYFEEKLKQDRFAINKPDVGREKTDRAQFFKTAISAMQELQNYRTRIEQLKHAEVWQFACKLPDGRICHFSDFIEFLEKGEVGGR